MIRITFVFKNKEGCELDRADVETHEYEDLIAQLYSAARRKRWILAPGDTITVEERPS